MSVFIYSTGRPHGVVFTYRIDDSSEGVEAAQDGKHVLDGVCDGGQLPEERRGETRRDRGEDGGPRGRRMQM